MKEIREKINDLIRECATELGKDVIDALQKSKEFESDEQAKAVLSKMLENTQIAAQKNVPLCQDTGTPIFFISFPQSYPVLDLRDAVVDCVRESTASVPLRPNAVDPVSGENSKDNTGQGVPIIHFLPWEKDRLMVELMLKGGGSENITRLYKLPDASIGAGRDLDGVRRCVLDAVDEAQGRGCPPYYIGVGVAGMTDAAITLSKRCLFRKVDDSNPHPRLSELESLLFKQANSLGIGPLGLGGDSTTLGVKCAANHRHPATYWVAVSFSCYNLRRSSFEVNV